MKYSNLIQEDIKQAMKDKQKDKLAALRAVKTSFTLAKTGKGGSGELEDDEEIKIMQKLVKQRKESADIYNEQNRPELAEKELIESKFIEEYLPAQLGEDEIRDIISSIIAELGASSMADMGRVMGQATSRMAGQADGKIISAIVRDILNS